MTVKKYGKILVETPPNYPGRYNMDNYIQNAMDNINWAFGNYYISICKYNNSGHCIYNATSRNTDYISALALFELLDKKYPDFEITINQITVYKPIKVNQGYINENK